MYIYILYISYILYIQIRVLGIFNGLLQTRSVKKYILREQLHVKNNNKFTEKKDEKTIKQYKKVPYAQVKNNS